MFVLLGRRPELAAQSAAAVMALETALAKASLDARGAPRAEERLPPAWSAKGLKAEAPGFPWDVYFTAAGATGRAGAQRHPPAVLPGASDRLVKTRSRTAWQALPDLALRGSRHPGAAQGASRTSASASPAQSAHRRQGGLPRWKKCVRPPTTRSARRWRSPSSSRRSARRARRRPRCRWSSEIEKAFERNLGHAGLDGRATTRKQALEKLAEDRQQDRLPGQVAQLRRAEGRRATRSSATRRARAAFETARQLGEDRQAGRPRPSG